MHGYGPVADIILCHHERMDGAGYPRSLAGDDIPVLARILSVCDTFDVMTSRDSYRTPIAVEDAIAELRRVSGTQLDGRLVEAFVGVITEAGVDFSHGDDRDLETRAAHRAGRRSGVEARRAGRRTRRRRRRRGISAWRRRASAGRRAA